MSIGEREKADLRLFESKKADVKRLLQQEGCPICNICDEVMEKTWFWFFNESYGDGSGASKYIDYWGFCRRHTLQMAGIGPSWQESVIYSWIIEDKLPRLKRLLKNVGDSPTGNNILSTRLTKKRLEKTIKEVSPSGGCLFCESVQRTAEHYIRLLLETLSDLEVKGLFRKSYGLCMRHFFQAINNPNPKLTIGLSEVVQLQIEKLTELKHNFEEFFRKSDYRFSHEPEGAEQTAWIRAIKRFVGIGASPEPEELNNFKARDIELEKLRQDSNELAQKLRDVTKSWMKRESEFASLHFRLQEALEDNRAMAIKISGLKADNETLSKILEREGLIHPIKLDTNKEDDKLRDKYLFRKA